jgi:segregation and condensation protein A
MSSQWQVKIPSFEGPLDLLLFLVAKQEFDIMDLPMAEITESYLAVIDSIGVDNLEDAGEYLLMAATLIAIKAQMMLPRPPQELGEEIEDPRKELAERLLIYQKVKEESEKFGEREAQMMERYEMKMSPTPSQENIEIDPIEMLYPMTVYDLTRAIEDILGRRETRKFHQVSLFKVSVAERVAWVRELIKLVGRFGLVGQLQTESERIVWVVSFLATLELAKHQEVHLEQNEAFSELYVGLPIEPEIEAA